ncbi:MAG: hypothetical protein AAGU75_19510, partial [Bacillota bacterium]
HNMARQNIFELLNSRWDLREELERISKRFDSIDIVTDRMYESYDLKKFVDFYCFNEWKNCGHYIDIDDFLKVLDFDGLYKRAVTDIDSFLSYIEIIYNFYYIVKNYVDEYPRWQLTADFDGLRNNMDMCLEHYNHTVIYFKEKEQAIVYEKDPAVTAVAEISDQETAFQIVQYNHHTHKGNILAKKSILLHLASELEPKRSILNSINKAFTDDIFILLNNLNLRHNNCDPHSKEYKQYIKEMPEDTIEEWYDELYQMILLAKLELDHLERKSKIAELKTHF